MNYEHDLKQAFNQFPLTSLLFWTNPTLNQIHEKKQQQQQRTYGQTFYRVYSVISKEMT